MNIFQIFLACFIPNACIHIYKYYLHPFFVKKDRNYLYSKVSILFSWIITSLACVIVLIISFKINFQSTLIKQIVIQTLALSIFPVYAFTIKPFIYLLQNNNKRIIRYESWLKNKGYTYKIICINFNVKNAFALGVLKRGKIILIGKPLLDEMGEDDIKSVILHEVGHHEKKHLYVLLLIMLIVSCMSSLLLVFTRSTFNGTSYEVLALAITGFIIGLFFYYAMYFQKPLEFQADLFATKIIGKEKYLNFLKGFAVLTNADLNKKSINHPTFNERINKINNFL